MSPPFSGWKNKSRNQREAGRKLAISFMMVSYLAYSSTLKMEATCSSETSFYFTRHYIPEDRILRVAFCFILINGITATVRLAPDSLTNRTSCWIHLSQAGTSPIILRARTPSRFVHAPHTRGLLTLRWPFSACLRSS
jgi:hypothetical protein